MRSLLTSILLLIVAIGLIIIYTETLIFTNNNPIVTDYDKFYQSTHLGFINSNLYTTLWLKNEETQQLSRFPSNLNPPFFQFLISPLGHLTYSISSIIWYLLSLVGGIGALLLIRKAMFPSASITLTIVGLLAFFAYYPTFVNARLEQVSLILLGFLTSAWLLARNNQLKSSAAVLGFLTSIKPFFGLFIFYWLIRREKTALLWFGITLGVCTLIPICVWGIKIYADYYHTLNRIYWYSSNWNASLYGVLVRLFGAKKSANTPIFHYFFLTKVIYYLTAILLLWKFSAALKANFKLDSISKVDYDFSLTIIMAILLSPLGWIYYFTFLVLPLAFLWRYSGNTPYAPLLHLIIGMVILLSSIPWPLVPIKQIMGTELILIEAGSAFYALILLLSLFFWLPRPVLHTANHPIQFSKLALITWYTILLIPSLTGVGAQTLHSTDIFNPYVLINPPPTPT